MDYHRPSIEDQKRIIISLQKTIQHLESKNQDLESSLQVTKREYELKYERLVKKALQLKTTLARLENDQITQTSSSTHNEAEWEALRSNLNAKETECQKLKEELEALRQSQVNKPRTPDQERERESWDFLANLVEGKEQEVLKRELAAEKVQLEENYKREITKLSELIKRYEIENAELLQLKSEKHSELSLEAAKIGEYENDLRIYQKKIDALEGQLQDLENRNQLLSDTCRQHNEKMNELKQSKNEALEKYESLQRRSADAEHRERQKDSEIETLRAQVSELKALMQRNSEDMSKKESEFAKMAEDLSRSREVFNARLEQLLEEVSLWKTKFEAKDSLAENQMKEIDLLNAKLEAEQETLRELLERSQSGDLTSPSREKPNDEGKDLSDLDQLKRFESMIDEE